MECWIGTLAHTNELLGLMHGFYGLGATISPLISTTMITKGNLGWWTFFYPMSGLAAIEIVTGSTAFWSETGAKYTDVNRANGEEKGMTRQSLKQKVTWICAIFLLCYVGLEGQSCLSHISFISLGLLLIGSYSIIGWLDRQLHDSCPKRRALLLRYDCYRLLARYHRWSCRARLHHTQGWRTTCRQCLPSPFCRLRADLLACPAIHRLCGGCSASGLFYRTNISINDHRGYQIIAFRNARRCDWIQCRCWWQWSCSVSGPRCNQLPINMAVPCDTQFHVARLEADLLLLGCLLPSEPLPKPKALQHCNRSFWLSSPCSWRYGLRCRVCRSMSTKSDMTRAPAADTLVQVSK